MSSKSCSKGHKNPTESRFCCRCGEPLQEVSHSAEWETALPTGTRVRNRYIIRHQLGQGGFGRTYLTEDTGRFNEVIVIKEFTPSFQGTYALQKAEELFQREAAMLHKLKHPQIPRFWEFFREGKRLFLVQDYIEGQTYQALLNDRIKAGKCFTEAEILDFLRKLLPVLSYLHTSGVIHRDISPDNIIWRAEDGLPVLIDLGGVKQIALEVANQLEGSRNTGSSGSGTRLGKMGYAPDEQLRIGTVAPHSDLYALAVTAVVLLTGKQPQELINPDTLDWVWSQQLSLSPQLRGVLNRMLASRPSERFLGADEILQQLPPRSAELEEPLENRSPVQEQAWEINPQSSSVTTNNSGLGKLFDKSVKVPEEILGWNWGAFLLPGFWCLSNQVWIGLLAWLDLTFITFFLALPIMAVVLGSKGNEWAWKSRQWPSVKAFKRHQRGWAIAGMIIVGSILLIILGIIGLVVILGTSSMGGMD